MDQINMSEILNLATENWRIIAIAAAVLSYFGWDKATALLGNFMKKKTPVAGNTVVDSSVEAADIAAIAHLRNRAVDSKNNALLQEIKSVSAKFFDLHSGVSGDTISSGK